MKEQSIIKLLIPAPKGKQDDQPREMTTNAIVNRRYIVLEVAHLVHRAQPNAPAGALGDEPE
jgi:hypothetical protein